MPRRRKQVSGPPDETRRKFEEGWKPRFGQRNPHRMDIPFWVDQIRSGDNAWQAREHLGLNREEGCEPTWCFDRFGQTRTRLPDGRVVCVAGEHEDFSDPDFFIYNDVVVFEPDGGIAVHGYPEEVFPPTDFHSATPVGGDLWLIGSLGYQGQDRDRCQVMRLNTRTFRIDRVQTGGEDPGWISGHRARLLEDGHTIRVWGGEFARRKRSPSNEFAWELDIWRERWRRCEPVAIQAAAESLPGPLAGLTDGRLEPMKYTDQYRAMDCVRRVTPPGHPLFGVEVWPVANDSQLVADVARVLDGSGRWLIIEVPWGEFRNTFPEPWYLAFQDADHLAAALPSLNPDNWRQGHTPAGVWTPITDAERIDAEKRGAL